ncbi:hydrogenase iron-sulfur subunit [Halobacterium sp. CBA1126]|uniref:hydrogenase iron-sulfur subunit n=1 Tax=Halobacterium sp. CBA1126 TaxID=2668074 RepID=UPI0012FB8FFA|nr:hydrogenase iron-sulfur subunit [Halobacterium sp. CBA1126]MUV60655.1 hydrogenase iron-sulfur subunit [Halobacterium sp. CBA1126]
MNVGAFVCGCGGAVDLDLEGVREGVRDVDVVASGSLLCSEGLPKVRHVVEEYDLDHLIVTAASDSCKRRYRTVLDDAGLHPDAISFVDHRERAAWVHDEADATDLVARKINAAYAGLREEAPPRSVSREAGDDVVVVGDPEAAEALSDSADVTLLADGEDFADADYDLRDVTIARGRVTDVDGVYGEFELQVQAGVTEDCIDCMECVEQGPDEYVTSKPVDVLPGAPDGDWVDCCPTDAIHPEERTVEADQVVYPDAARDTRGGRMGFYTGPVDAATVAAVQDLLGGIEKPQFLDVDMDVCAAGASSQQGCTVCSDACPHGAVSRPSIDSVEFDEVACEGCGACTSACPTGAVRAREPSNERIAREVESLLVERDDAGLLSGDDGIETGVVAFVCDERASRALDEYGRRARQQDGIEYPPLLPVEVPCADTVGEAHVLHALAAGADGVAIVGCGGDCLHSGPDPKADLVKRLNRATNDLGLGHRTAFFAPEPGEPEAFVEDVGRFVEFGLDPSPVPTGHDAEGVADPTAANPEFNTHDWALESVRAILPHVDARDVIRGLESFGRVEVSDDCTFTPTCSNLCPTDALRREEAGLEFNHERCVNCGLCEEGCMEDAITVEGGLEVDLLPEHNDGDAWTAVADGEMRECRRCGKPFTSEASARKISEEVGDVVSGIAPDADGDVFEYCGDCRAKLVYDR